MEHANPQNYQGNGDRGNKHQKDEGTERNDSADGNNGNGDEHDGGGEEVGVEEGVKGKIQMMRALIKMIELVMKIMVIMIHHHHGHCRVHLISATGHKKSPATCLNLHHGSSRKTWLGNPLGILWTSLIIWNFHRNFIFLIVNCVPAYMERVPSGSESSPAIDSSNFMNWKTFLHFVFSWPTKRTSTCLPQPVDSTIIHCIDMGIIPDKVLMSPI
jgi:hypothetical protein